MEILHKILLQQKKDSSNEGFITIEILVSIFIALAFFAFALQGVVLGLYLKVQAQEDQRADQMIQEDLEELQDVATANVLTKAVAEAKTTNTTNICSPGSYNAGFGNALWLAFTDISINPLYQATPSQRLTRTLENGALKGQGTLLTLTRTHVSATNNAAPYRTLRVHYQVKDPDDEIIANRYVEVIPDVALECP